MNRTLLWALVGVSMSSFADDRSELVAAGRGVYEQTCIACHGANGKGAFPGVTDFTAPTGPLAKSDEVLITNIVNGYQSPGGSMSMPPNGGNPGLDETDVVAALAYLRATFGK